MKLKEIVTSIKILSSNTDLEQEIGGVCYDSRRVRPGDLFVAVKGFASDGHRFIPAAMEKGAAAVLCEDVPGEGVPYVQTDDCRLGLALVSRDFYGNPAAHMKMIGFTGTNGKTTSSYLMKHLLEDRLQAKVGLIGTNGNWIGEEYLPSEHTTPESCDLHALFRRMADAGCTHVVMEVSSHSLALQRVAGIRFDVAVFTNLTQDHLDYHHTFEAYFEAKALLFSKDYPAKRVICIDDKWGKELHRRCSNSDDWLITTGFDPSAQIHPISYDLAATHTSIELDVRGRRVAFDYPLVGRFNVSNVMTAFGIALALGIPIETIVFALSNAPQVPGRLERVKASADGGISVFVDYAHTPDALAKAVSSVKALTTGRSIVVFGCGGDRDASKRSIMGRAALDADYAIVTSDNPRSEDPNDIIADIVSGMGDAEDRYEVVPDRREAIARAIALAKPGDAILVAGKGHEDYQIIGDKVLSFDDCKVAAEELEKVFA